jgi:hypothetical protein
MLLVRSKLFIYNKRSRYFMPFLSRVMNWFVREKDDYMFLYESYYLFSYIIDISVDFEPHFYKKRNQLPHDPTTNPGIRSNGLWSHHLNPDTDIIKCTKKSCPLRHKWLPLVLLSPGMRYKSRSMSKSWCWILYIITSLLILLRCSKVCHSSDVNMLVTHPCVLLV